MLLSSVAPTTATRHGLAVLRRDAGRDALWVAALLALVAGAVVAMGWLGAGFALKALAVFALASGLAWRGLAGHMPHRRFGAANRVTLLRLAMIALLAGAIGEAPHAPAPLAWTAVVLATTAALLDALDGPLARSQGLASDFGARFDMESDALLMGVLSLLVWHFGKAGGWIVLAGLARYLFVAAAWAWPWLAWPLPPSLRRKAVCVLAITGLIVCLGPVIAVPWSQAIGAACLALLAFSFGADLLWLGRRRLLARET